VAELLAYVTGKWPNSNWSGETETGVHDTTREKKRMKAAHGQILHAHRQPWSIEGYYRPIKQVCHTPEVLRALEAGHWPSWLLRPARLPQGGRRFRGLTASWYELKRSLIGEAARDFIYQMAGQHTA
jgi:hypothetical protein